MNAGAIHVLEQARKAIDALDEEDVSLATYRAIDNLYDAIEFMAMITQVPEMKAYSIEDFMKKMKGEDLEEKPEEAEKKVSTSRMSTYL